MINEIYDYLEAGFRVFGVHGASQGICGCGNPECKALLKHPVISSWQSVPAWSDEQIETFAAMGHFDTGFGVLCSGWLIIDVDARNGGIDSFARLCADCPAASTAAYVVNTGSGGGSQHHYFKLAEKTALVQTDKRYPGIDIKTSGYVIGAGSRHASGALYESARGFPQDITDAPAALLAMFARPDHFRVSSPDGDIDIDAAHIVELLGFVAPDVGYDAWIKIGMAIHHCMSGAGFELWDEWSAGSGKYPGIEKLERHWHSFGKSPNPAGYGTLRHYAQDGGYVEPVTFVYDEPHSHDAHDIDSAIVDLKRPPGFVGELVEWINAQCLYPRESLSVAVALCAVSSLAGMRYVDELDDMSANLIAFCVAGSGTGKEPLQQAYLAILRAAGVQAAAHGGFKSEQELMRNLIRHQAAFYCIDELGLILNKLENASKRGGASYLEGIIGLIMSVYSKANGFLPITGDLKEEIRDHIMRETARIEKRLEESQPGPQQDRLQQQADSGRAALAKLDCGLDSPFLSILGFTTPVTFNLLMGFEQATNGFMARAMIFEDLETNPRRKNQFKKRPMPDSLANALRNLYAPGVFDVLDAGGRVEFVGDKSSIPTTHDAAELLNEVYDRFHALAETHKSATGLEAIPRRGYEICSKVSLVLAMASGVRTAEHVQWAYALAKRDCENKIKMAHATEHEDDTSGLAARIMSIVSKEHGELIGVICNRLRKQPKERVLAVVKSLVDRGDLKEVVSRHAGNGKEIIRYFSTE